MLIFKFRKKKKNTNTQNLVASLAYFLVSPARAPYRSSSRTLKSNSPPFHFSVRAQVRISLLWLLLIKSTLCSLCLIQLSAFSMSGSLFESPTFCLLFVRLKWIDFNTICSGFLYKSPMGLGVPVSSQTMLEKFVFWV